MPASDPEQPKIRDFYPYHLLSDVQIRPKKKQKGGFFFLFSFPSQQLEGLGVVIVSKY